MEGDTSNNLTTNSQEIPIPCCIKDNKSFLVCQNPECKSYVFICDNQDCQCQKEHQICMQAGLKPLINIVSRKIEKPKKQLVEYIEKITDDMIDEISQLKDCILIRLEYLGLNKNQRNFFQFMKKKEYDKISAKQIHDVCFNAYVKESIKIQNSMQYIQQYWENERKKFDSVLKSLSDNLQKSLYVGPLWKGINSKIVSPDEFKDLMEMFDQEITNANLLYRASEHKFSISQFKKVFDKKINNLSIVKTQFGNIIGAFTPIAWNNTISSDQYVNDPSCKTFIFSLTLRKKFVQTNGGKYTTHHYLNWGPRFGITSLCDLAIGNASKDTSINCYANIGNLFTPVNQEDNKNIEFIKQNFVGGGVKGTTDFKLTQWEMFQLTF